MKLILLQVTRSALFLTPVRSGHTVAFGTPRVFELPEVFRKSGTFSDLPRFAKFVKDCIRKESLRTNKILFCLEDSSLIVKEYQHLPCKKRSLLSFAKLEAESVLPDGVDEYIIQNYEYGNKNEVTGKMTGSLYAVKDALISGIMKAFPCFGLHVVKIMPPVGGLLCAAKSGVNSKDSTVAVLELGFKKTHLLVFHNGCPIIQRSFESIFDDLIDLQMETKSVSYKEAFGLISTRGVYGTDSPDLTEETNRRIATLLDVGANEIIRNIRMALSRERLELNKLVLCGTMTMIPHLIEFWEKLDLDVPLETANRGAAGKLPRMEADAKRAGYQPAAFFAACGMLSARKSDDIDFLNYKRAQKSRHAANALLLVLVTLVTVSVMLLEPLLYYEKSIAYKGDEEPLKNYAEIQSLLKSQSDLSAAFSKAKADQDKLPSGKSNAREITKQLFLQIAAKAQSMESFEIDNTTGAVTVQFKVSAYSNYVAIKQSIESDKYFTVFPPISVAREDGGAYSCSLVLKPNGFVPYISGNKDGGAK